MKRHIIIIAGRAGSGKDTAGRYLTDAHGFTPEAYAIPLKRAITAIFGVPYPDLHNHHAKNQPVDGWPHHTPRTLMQTIGTDLLRDQFDKDIWIRSLAGRIARQHDNPRWVITDARFPNELRLAEFLPPDPPGRTTITTTILIRRPVPKGFTAPDHASEKLNVITDYIIDNDQSVGHLCAKLDHILAAATKGE